MQTFCALSLFSPRLERGVKILLLGGREGDGAALAAGGDAAEFVPVHEIV